MDTSSEETVSNQTPNTNKQKGNGVQTTRHVGLPVRVQNGNFFGHRHYITWCMDYLAK